MKLLRYGPSGKEKPGVLDDAGGLRDLSGVVSDINGDALLPESLDRLRAVSVPDLPVVDGEARLGPCVGSIGKLVCIGLNYSDHAAEAGLDLPTEPVVFLKATSAIVGPDDDVQIPRGAKAVDWEVELAIVIGTEAKYVDESAALDHVAGYCVVNDVSERDYQFQRQGQWVKGKSADTFAPVGPWMVTRDEIEDPQNLDLWLDVNGHRFQNGNTRTMVFGVVELVSYVSQFMSLQPGDIISTGTPPGVGFGQKPPVYLKAGDVMELEVAGLGRQTQHVIDAS